MDSKEIFTMIAQTALAMGYEIELEQKDYDGESKVIGGMSNSRRTDKGLILRVFTPKAEAAEDPADEADEEANDEEEDEDDDNDAAYR